MSLLNKLQVVLITLLFVSCKNEPNKHTTNKTLQIVTTTGMLADAIKNITLEKANVTPLMGPGVDPHLYKAAHGDLQTLTDADIIIYNGIHLEGKMVDILEKLGRTKTVISAGASLPPSQLRFPDNDHTPDPHIWFNVNLWSIAIENISKELCKASPENASYFKENTTIYITQLKALHRLVSTEINNIPKEQRLLITAHDAFGYFGDEYDIEVKGLQGISTVSQAGLKDVEALVSLIIQRKIKAIFIESSISKKQIEVVLESCKKQGHDLKIGGVLYSDAMGDPTTPEGSYIGMVKHNVNTIVTALK